ncbi:MAG: sel1 repeat family protein [Siculibacillus sp.]|nr:sel1 repeat family protein [Siculibacillus sp.]
MWFGTLLRFGMLTAAVAVSGGAASALDPNARSVPNEPLAPTIQALAPLPGTSTAIPAPAAPVLSQLPPGISPKLVGPAIPGNAANAGDSFRAGTRLYYEGDRKGAIEQLRRAAENGHPIAQWKLGRIYQTGDGVPVNDAKAFDFYNQVANNHADDSPASPQSAFVASAFVALGGYYLKGIDNTAVRPNVQKAREIYTYAASYFGDSDAQFNLGRLYLDTDSKERDPKQAARWLRVAAKKGHVGAQALLGQLLFTGDDDVPRRPAQGLMWLTVARANANAANEDWIRDAQEQAFSVASEQERRLGVAQAQDWIAKSGNQ